MAALKYSKQRQAIKDFLATRKDHPTADMIYENLKQEYPNISLGTIYRNLALLTDIGEVLKISSFEGPDRFDGRVECHCHFMCTECGNVIDLDKAQIHPFIDSVSDGFNGKISHYMINFSGICENCCKEEK